MFRGYEAKTENLNSRPPPVQLSWTVFSKKLWIKCPDDVITCIFNALMSTTFFLFFLNHHKSFYVSDDRMYPEKY